MVKKRSSKAAMALISCPGLFGDRILRLTCVWMTVTSILGAMELVSAVESLSPPSKLLLEMKLRWGS